jgi:hypothetical protein
MFSTTISQPMREAMRRAGSPVQGSDRGRLARRIFPASSSPGWLAHLGRQCDRILARPSGRRCPMRAHGTAGIVVSAATGCRAADVPRE